MYTEQFGCTGGGGPQRRAVPAFGAVPAAPGKIRLAHSGAAVPGRNLEGTIEAVKMLDDRFTLDLYLVKARDGGRYWQQLKDLAASDPRITFHDAVPPEELPRDPQRLRRGGLLAFRRRP